MGINTETGARLGIMKIQLTLIQAIVKLRFAKENNKLKNNVAYAIHKGPFLPK